MYWLHNIKREVHCSATKVHRCRASANCSSAAVDRADCSSAELLRVGRTSSHRACENGSVRAGKDWGLRRWSGQQPDSNERDASPCSAASGTSLAGSSPATPSAMESMLELRQAHRAWPVSSCPRSERNGGLLKWRTQVTLRARTRCSPSATAPMSRSICGAAGADTLPASSDGGEPGDRACENGSARAGND